MTSKLTIAKVGGGEIELTGFTGLKGAPFLDRNDNLVELGQRFANGEASQGTFKLLDPVGELPRTDFEYNLPAHKLVTWTEDASGDEIWLSRGRVSTYDGGRGFALAGDQVEYDATVDDGNVELRGQAFTEPWVRSEETGHARLVALQAYTLDGATSTNPTARATCEITFSDSHLAPDSDTATMPAKTYPPGTQPQEVVTECADTEGKVYGVVIHHTGGSHLCLQYILEGDHTTYVSPIKISDQIADWDPTDLTAPVFEPHWEMGKATVYDGQELVSGLVSTFGADQFVFSEHADNITDYDRWIEHFSDAESENVTQAMQVNESERTFRQLTHVTHRVSVIMLPEQVHLVTAGMSLQIKATAAIAGQYLGTYQTRRIAEHSFRPRSDGRYWADLNLDRVIRRRSYRAGAGTVTVPKHPSECEGGCVETFTRSVDPGWGIGEINGGTHSANAIYNVNGSEGGARQTSNAGPTPAYLPIIASTPFEILIKRKFIKHAEPTPSTGNYISLWNVLNNTGSYLDPVGVVLSWEVVSGDLSVAMQGTTNFLPLGVVLADYTSDTWIWMRWRVEAAMLYVKTWYDGSPEPGAWSATLGTGAIGPPTYLGWAVHTFHADADMEFRDTWYQVTEGMECDDDCPTPGTIVGTGDGEFADSGFYVPAGSLLEHGSIVTGGPYHELTQLGDVDLATPPDDLDVLAFDAASSTWKPVAPSGGLHAASHSNGGADEVSVENLGTAETATTLVLSPDGAGGVEFRAEAGGGAGMAGELVTDTIIGDGAEDTFTLSETPTGGWALVSTNGADLLPSEYAISGGDIVFDDPPATDAEVLVTFIAGGYAAPATDPGDIADPTIATAEDVANKVNDLMAELRTAGIIV